MVIAVAWLRVLVDSNHPSRSVGSPESGLLVGGDVIPPFGPGCTTYSYLGAALGRQYVHGSVRAALLHAFADRLHDEPDRVWVVGETGWRGGGEMRPHRSHENGMSVDVFVPVIDDAGLPSRVPTWPWNRFGYGIEFDGNARADGLRIDFEALSAFLASVDRRSREAGVRLRRVILAPEYAPRLLDTRAARAWPGLRGILMQRPAWVRHDEHVHLDFQ